VKLLTILAVIGIAVAAAGCAGDGDEGGAEVTTAPAESRPVPKLVTATTVEGGSAQERDLLREVVAGLEETSLREIAIRPAAERRETEGGRAMAITFTTIPAATVRRQWDEWIVAGALSRRLLAADLPAEVDAQDDRGSFTARPRLDGKPDPQPLSQAREDVIVNALRNAASKAKAEVVTLDVHRPYGAAVALTVAPEATAAFLKNQLRALLQSLEAQRTRLEGIYLAVLDEEGKLALEWASWTRNPAGVYWVRRDLANCSPIRQSEPPGTEPPPACPA
jgi:hypothetical protein